MTIIERIGQFTIARHGQAVIVLDRVERDHVVFHNERDAREYALERADLVDVFNATIH